MMPRMTFHVLLGSALFLVSNVSAGATGAEQLAVPVKGKVLILMPGLTGVFLSDPTIVEAGVRAARVLELVGLRPGATRLRLEFHDGRSVEKTVVVGDGAPSGSVAIITEGADVAGAATVSLAARPLWAQRSTPAQPAGSVQRPMPPTAPAGGAAGGRLPRQTTPSGGPLPRTSSDYSADTEEETTYILARAQASRGAGVQLGLGSSRPSASGRHWSGTRGALFMLGDSQLLLAFAGDQCWRPTRKNVRFSFSLGAGFGNRSHGGAELGLVGLAGVRLSIGPLFAERLVLTKDILGSNSLESFGLAFAF